MSEQQSHELFSFPCDFPIKVFGLACDEFEIAVLSIIRQHTADLSTDAIRCRYSKDNKYISLTITIKAENQPQLDAIYQALTQCKHVIMAL